MTAGLRGAQGGRGEAQDGPPVVLHPRHARARRPRARGAARQGRALPAGTFAHACMHAHRLLCVTGLHRAACACCGVRQRSDELCMGKG